MCVCVVLLLLLAPTHTIVRELRAEVIDFFGGLGPWWLLMEMGVRYGVVGVLEGD